MVEDNYSLWLHHEAEKERWLSKRPQCDECCKPIQSEVYFEFDGMLICEECLDLNHKRFTDNFIL